MTVDLKDNEKLADLLSGERDNKLLLVKFEASWCRPCKALAPVLEGLAAEWAEDVDFYALDVDDDPDAANEHQVRSIPTLVLFDEQGAEIGRLTGLNSRGVIEAFLSDQFEE